MAHQEVGHIVYYQSYKLQDAVFRSGANPGRLLLHCQWDYVWHAKYSK